MLARVAEGRTVFPENLGKSIRRAGHESRPMRMAGRLDRLGLTRSSPATAYGSFDQSIGSFPARWIGESGERPGGW
jgi:hypothetical protein